MKQENYDLIRNEIEALKLCQHPNIMRLYDVHENLEYMFLVTELLPGGTLRDYVKKYTGGVPEENAKRIVRSLVSALEYMQKYGIVHRDLKPINILMTTDKEDFVVKVIDFGLAIILGPGQSCHNYAGTLNFCAPEVIIGIPYSFGADIWSFGIITYYLLYGTLPFTSPSDIELKRYIDKLRIL